MARGHGLPRPYSFVMGLVEIQNQARDGRAGSEFGDVQGLIADVLSLGNQ